VRVAAEQATELEKRLVALRDEWQVMISDARQREGKVRATRRDSALRTILDSLPGTPVLTTATVTRVHGVTATAAQSALTQLTEYGVLETISIGAPSGPTSPSTSWTSSRAANVQWRAARSTPRSPHP